MTTSARRPAGAPPLALLFAFACSLGWATGVSAQSTGTIRGIVQDATTGSPVVGASAEALGTGVSATTGPAGSFVLQVPAGTHQVRVFAPFYRSTLLEDVTVAPGGSATANATLAPTAASAIEVIEIVADAARGSEAGELSRRLQAPTVSDTISAEIIRKLPGSDVASVAKRVPSVTIQNTPDGEKVICVRGLCNRYTIGLVDGILLPSTNPTKRLVPAEIFPAEFLGSLAVYKSFLPNLRGNFQGAQVEFELRDPPEDLSYSLNVSTGGNSQAIGQDVQTYKGTSADYWGFGEEYRSLPDGLPGDLSLLQTDQRARYGKQFRNVWNVDSTTAPPDLGLKGSVGNTYGPLGFLLAAVYKNEWRHREEFRQTLRADSIGGDVRPTNVVPDTTRSSFNTRLGGFLSANLTLTDENILSLRSFVSRRSQDEVSTSFFGRSNDGLVSGAPGADQLDWRLRYLEDQVAFNMLRGEHRYEPLEIGWRAAIAETSRREPDTRHNSYRSEEKGQPLQWEDDTLSGFRINNTTDELLYDAGIDFTVPFTTWLPFTDVWDGLAGNLKFGAAYTLRERDFAQRIFNYTANPGTQNLRLDPESIFAPGNIGLGGARFTESTLATDAYSATEQVVAGYAMAEIPIIEDRLRVIGGVRREDGRIELDTIVQRNEELGLCLDVTNQVTCPFLAVRDDSDLLPGVSLIFTPLDAMNFRLGYSETVSRPEFRELAPSFFPAQRGQVTSIGNITLVQSTWTNYDFRWEWLFGDNELVSLSAFYKEGQQPIEAVELQVASTLNQTWINGEETKLLGFEFEGRKNLGFVHEWIDGVSFSTNVAWFPSKETTVSQQSVAGLSTTLTSVTRSPVDVPDFIVNATLEYELPGFFTARLLYQTVGETMVAAGSVGVGDAFEQRADQLDLVLQIPLDEWIDQPLRLQITGENLTNDQFIVRQDDFTTRRYTRGIEFGIGLTYSY
jgi:hypothetical protein